MVARVLDPPRNLPGSPVVIHAIAAHAGMCVACHADPLASAHGTSAQPQHDGSIGPQQTQGVRQDEPLDQADASLSELLPISAPGSPQPVQVTVGQVDSMTHPCEHRGLLRIVAGDAPSCSPVSLSASQQHDTSGTLSHAAEACSSRAHASNCRCCSKWLPLKGRDATNEQVAGSMSDQGLDRRRSSRHSLSTVEACAAFLADTGGLSSLQAAAPTGSSTKRTVVSSSLGQDRDASQHCQGSKSCPDSMCLALADGLGAGEQPRNGNQAQTACCEDADGQTPSHVTSSSNEAWHARIS